MPLLKETQVLLRLLLALKGLVFPLKSIVFPSFLIKCNLIPLAKEWRAPGCATLFGTFLGGYGGVGPGGVEPEKCDLARS